MESTTFSEENLTFDDPLQLPTTMSNALINFSIPLMSTNAWKSPNTSTFHHPGMDGLFSIANQTLNAIFPNHDQYLDYIERYQKNNSTINFTATDILSVIKDVEFETLKSFVWENSGPLAFVISMLLFGLIITLCGFCWCCAKCFCGGDKVCCGCSGSKDPDDILSKKLVQKRDKCKRSFYGIVFAGLVILYMFGLVSCFMTNAKLQSNVEQMPSDLDNALTDTELYLDTTKKQILSLFITNYDKLAVVLNDTLDRSGEILITEISERSGIEALRNVTDLLDTVENVRTSLQSVETSSRNLKLQAKQLELGLTEAKSKLLALLEQCDSTKCAELKSSPEIKTLRVENDFKNLPNMTEILSELGLLLGSDVKASIERGKVSLDELSTRIQREVEPIIPEIRYKIKSTGEELAKVANSLVATLDKVPIGESKDKLYEKEEFINKYEPQRYQAVLAVCILLAFIFSLLAFGIFIGFCGKQPGSAYSDECCSRNTGSGFINCGIFFMFLTAGALSIISITLFVGVGTLTQIACDAIQAVDNRTENILQIRKIQIESKGKQKQNISYVAPAYSAIIESCKQGESAYNAFDLKNIYDIQNIKVLSERFTKEVNKLASEVHLPAGSTRDITFLTPEAKSQLDRFSNSKITRMNFENIVDQLTDSAITSVDLNDVIRRLNETIEDPDVPVDNEIKLRLLNEVLHLETLNHRVLLPMLKEVKQSAENLKSLAREQKDLVGRIQQVASAAQKAQDSFRSPEAARQLVDLAAQFSQEFVNQINNYANFTFDQIDKVVGQCSPLFNAYSATINVFCVKIGSPMAGFWFALTCILLLFAPLIIVGSTLARLYRKYKMGVYETETYHSTAYGPNDGDTIPLSLSANQGRRTKRGRVTPDQAQSSDFRQNARFEDTSHKAWGSQMAFNNHHTPPASGEYERPPPYYYPGPVQ